MRRPNLLQFLQIFSVLCIFTACSVTRLLAQSASVSGQVLDANGAAVAGAQITLIRPSTEVKYTTTSDTAGVYILPPAAPGTYDLTITASGFSPWQDKDIVLEVGAPRTIKAVLAVGSVSSTVTVTDAAQEINTDDPNVSTVTENALVQSIPLDVRNPFQLQNFTAGVTQSNALSAGTNLTSQYNTNSFYVNGTKLGESEILIDGAVDTVFYDAHAAGAIPSLDAVREFRIYTTALSPEFDHMGGSVASYSINSGTRDLHGSAFEYFRNQDLDAAGWNINSAGQKKPDFGRNQFGGSIGGPVVIPHVYHGRDRTFFFGSYDEMLDSAPYNSTGLTTTVPTALEKTGDFSQSTAWTLYDPATTQSVAAGGSYSCSDGKTYTASAAGYYRCPMYYNGRYNVIPPSELNATAQALLTMYPAPNQNPTIAGSDENNYYSSAPSVDHDYYYDIRIDHKINESHSIFGHIDFFNHFASYGAVFGQPSLTPTNGNEWIPGRNFMVDHTWVISPKMIFDHHISYAHFESHRQSTDPLGTAKYLIPDSAAPGITSTFTPQIEAVTNQLGVIGNYEPYERNPASVYQYAAALTLLKGKHTFKFGVDLRRYYGQLYDPQLLTVNPATSNFFTGGPDAQAQTKDSGNAAADILLGQATVTSGFAPRVNYRHMYYGIYAMDTAKLSSNFTLMYGLRYNLEGADVSNGNLLTYLDTTSPSPIASQIAANPYFNSQNLVGGVGVVGLNGSGRELQIPEKVHFAPRLGIAYALNSKTVFHAGAGVFWHATPTWGTNPAAYGYTRKSTSIDAASNGVTPTYSLSNPFPNSLPAVYGNNPAPLPGNNTGSGPLSIELGQAIAGNPRGQQVAYQETFTADIQRELPAHFVLTAVYVSNTGVHLYGAVQLDQLTDAQLATGSALTAVVPNPFYGVITDTSSVLSKPTVQAGLLERPYPQFTSFQDLNVGYGHANYQAGQFTVEHRMDQGLSLLLAYTWSKSIDDVAEVGTSATIQDNGCMRCERSIADLDQTNVLRVSSIYQLPMGHGKPFISSGPLSYILGGWEAGGTFQYNTGQPLQLTSPLRLSSLDGENVMRPTLVPDENITTKVVNPKTGQRSDFNPAAFTETGVYSFGNAPRYLSNVRYPAYVDLDAVVKKTFRLGDRMSATLRFEALNALNYVVFGGADTGVTDANFGYNPKVQANTPRIAQISGRFTF